MQSQIIEAWLQLQNSTCLKWAVDYIMHHEDQTKANWGISILFGEPER